MSEVQICQSVESNNDLLQRCAAGDEQAFAQFYEQTATRAHALAMRVLRNRELAEEVTQEAYLDVWRLAGRCDGSRGSAMSWLLTLVHRRAVDWVRANRAASRRDEIYLRRESAAIDPDPTSLTALAALDAGKVRAALATRRRGEQVL